MFDTIIAAFNWAAMQWTGTSGEVKAAIIGAFGTAVLAAIAIWQIGKQAKLAIHQNRQNEAQKLKLEIYERSLEAFQNFFEAEAEYSGFLRQISMDLVNYKFSRNAGLTPKPIRARATKLNSLNLQQTMRTMELIRLVERWHIIDPRLYLFQTALNVVNYDINEAHKAFFPAALRVLPVPKADAADEEAILPWALPSDSDEKQLLLLLDDLLDAIDEAANYVTDFQTEMQNLLLGDLFEHKARIREPLDPSKVVLRLNEYDQLMVYFDKQTAWGKHCAELHQSVSARFAAK